MPFSPLKSRQRVVFLLSQDASLLPSHLLAVEVRVNTTKVFFFASIAMI